MSDNSDQNATAVEAIREIRINPVVPSESVLVATARGMRPKKKEEKVERDNREHVDTCPFCYGNENMTPPALMTVPPIKNEGDKWHIRIVENLFAVLGDETQRTNLTLGLQQTIDGYGRHEVIIDHNNHGIAIHEMTEAHISDVFKTYRDRMQALYQADERIRYVLVFKNYGKAAGASIPHTHSQLIAMPVIPENVHSELHHAHVYFEKHNQCIFCSLIDEALTFEATIYDRDSGAVRRKIDIGQYVIEKSQHFIAIKPFASRYEWEVHIMPLQHQADFIDSADDKLEDFARLLKRTMTRLDVILDGAQFNYFMHTVPHGKQFNHMSGSYHWHLEITPRTSIPTGFELGSGLFVNTISPEAAAQQLREVELDQRSRSAE